VAIRRNKLTIAIGGTLAVAVIAGCGPIRIPFVASIKSPGHAVIRRPAKPAAPKPPVAKPPVVTPPTTTPPVVAPPAPPAETGKLGERVGISAGSSILWQSDAVRQRKLDAVAASGAKWFEFDIDWNSIQAAGPTSYMWTNTDNVVRDAKARGLKILAMVGYAPAWARPSSCPAGSDKCLPADPATYAAFAGAAVERYGATAVDPSLRGSILAWQVWNEANHGPFVTKVNVPAYTHMLKLAFMSMKTVDPMAIVLAGGTSPAPDDPSGSDMQPATFLKQMYANGAKGFFDAFSHHPYSFPCTPLTHADWNAFTQTLTLHNLMVANGDSAKKIWATEAGAPTGADIGNCSAGSPGSSVTEANQSKWMEQYFQGWYSEYASFTGPLFWFQIQDNGTDPMVFDDHFGLLRTDFTPKPAYATLQRLTNAAG
jgi:polysaccharide biosynthesis protein PslG